MRFFVDTADVTDIRALNDIGLIDGVTTNPSLILKSGRAMDEVIREICSVVDGPVSAEVAATDYDAMMAEAEVLAKYGTNVCIKLPLTLDGLKACKALTSAGYTTNVTLCFSVNQALLAAKAGATFVSPFIGRLEDVDEDGVQLIRDIRAVYDRYPDLKTHILAASIRTPEHVTAVALAGADVATVPATIITRLVQHPLTDKGLAQFVEDWKKTGQSIVQVSTTRPES